MTTDADNAAQIISQLASYNVAPDHLRPGEVYAYMTPAGPQLVDLLTSEKYLDRPRRKRGMVVVQDVASFACYYQKHSDQDSEIFADRESLLIVAVLDAHEPGAARWQGHLLQLRLAVTPEWAAWTGSDRTMMPQSTFAEFIEDHIADVAPDGPCTGAELLEMAQQFQAHSKVEFKAGHRLASGQTQFVYTETIDAKAGERGTIEIPTAFELGIPVFDDLEPYRVKARFRFRLADGQLRLGYHLDDPERKVRDAVGLVMDKTAALCGCTVMRGRP
jgi:uncharacterized protein YfdQ (DUF2303 family)